LRFSQQYAPFTALLEMIDNRRFSRGATLDVEALHAVTVRRLKRDITEKGFLAREIKVLLFTPSDDEEAAFDRLDDILTRSAKANGRKRSGDIVALLLKKRFLSSPCGCLGDARRGNGTVVRPARLAPTQLRAAVLRDGRRRSA